MKKIAYLIAADFIMVCGIRCFAQTSSGEKGSHEYVDLGLPSGTLWATCNVGASKPEEYGDYFAWGETSPKKKYTWETYRWSKGGSDIQSKYCRDRKYGIPDSLKTLNASDDAAVFNWGGGWRIPTLGEQQELVDGCYWKWTSDYNGNGVSGCIGTSKVNRNTIFLPAAGDRSGIKAINTINFGDYWSSSLSEVYSYCAYSFSLSSEGVVLGNYSRFYGHCIRAVLGKK